MFSILKQSCNNRDMLTTQKTIEPLVSPKSRVSIFRLIASSGTALHRRSPISWIISKFVFQMGQRFSGMTSPKSSFLCTSSQRSIFIEATISEVLPIRSNSSATFEVHCLLVNFVGMPLTDCSGFLPQIFLLKLSVINIEGQFVQLHKPSHTTNVYCFTVIAECVRWVFFGERNTFQLKSTSIQHKFEFICMVMSCFNVFFPSNAIINVYIFLHNIVNLWKLFL